MLAAPTFGVALLLMTTLLLNGADPCLAAKYLPPLGRNTAVPLTTNLGSFRSSMQSVLQSLAGMDDASAYKEYQLTFKSSKTAPERTDPTRQAIFKSTLNKVLAINSDPKATHVAGLNMFSDYTSQELKALLGTVVKLSGGPSGRRTLQDTAAHAFINITATEAESQRDVPLQPHHDRLLGADPNLPDWSTVLPRVKNHGTCGSVWAFPIVAVTEAAHFILTGQVISLSEKQLVDCDKLNDGCNGGLFDSAFEYVIKNGLVLNSDYPYIAVQSTCPASLPPPASKLASYTKLPVNNESAMLAALANGPIAVGVTVDDGWYTYNGGVYSSSSCGDDMNHAVLVVGAGVDDSTNLPYWLLRNSWGDTWGEGGYIRLLRGSGPRGMCNVAVYPYQGASAGNIGPRLPSSPGPGPGPSPIIIYTAKASDSLADVARSYKVPISQIILDNGLTWKQQLIDGQRLKMQKPAPGVTWSEPYGVWNNWNAGNAMSEVPSVHSCPPGEYAVSFYIKPSRWYTANQWTGSCYVGQVSMTCSDGSKYTVDAQPGFNPGDADGTISQANGFTSIPLKTSGAIDSMFGVGAQSGSEGSFNCPSSTMITGFAAGASSLEYPMGWIVNLQFKCSNPFVSTATLMPLRLAQFPVMRSGVSCPVYTALPGDTWMTVAKKKDVRLTDLIRSNPAVSGSIKADDKLFLPPCSNGAIQGTMTR